MCGTCIFSFPLVYRALVPMHKTQNPPAAATFLSFLLVYRALVPMQKTQNHPAAVTFLKFSAGLQSARTNAENSNPPFFSRFFNYKHFLLTQRFKYIFSFEKKNYKCEKGGGGLKTPKMGSKMSLSPPQAKIFGVYFAKSGDFWSKSSHNPPPPCYATPNNKGGLWLEIPLIDPKTQNFRKYNLTYFLYPQGAIVYQFSVPNSQFIFWNLKNLQIFS